MDAKPGRRNGIVELLEALPERLEAAIKALSERLAAALTKARGVG